MVLACYDDFSCFVLNTRVVHPFCPKGSFIIGASRASD